MSKARWKLLLVPALAGLLGLVGSTRPAHADPPVQICTFTNDAAKMNYADGYHRDSLSFSWNNSTGEVTNVDWHFTFGGTERYYATAPNQGTVAPGFDASSSVVSTSAVNIQVGNTTDPTNIVLLKGLLANNLPAGQANFAGIEYQTGTAWISGKGTVTCVNQ